MIPAEVLVERLQDDLTRKTYSFAEYVTMSSPYIPPGKQPMFDLLLRHRDEDHEHARALGRVIVDLGGVPNPGLFNEGVADMNYLDIRHLYKLLIGAKEQSVQAFEERLREAGGYPEAETVLKSVLEAERKQLAELKSA